MDERKLIFASNLIRLRTEQKMTQAELAAKINYSDKSVSKWERADALPDPSVIESIAAALGVDSEYLLSSHDEWKPSELTVNTRAITLICIIGVWTLALLLFVIFWMLGKTIWLILVAAVPVSLIVLLVFNSIWHRTKYHLYIVLALVLSIFVLVYLSLLRFNPWQLFLVLIPAELIVYLSFRIQKRKTK